MIKYTYKKTGLNPVIFLFLSVLILAGSSCKKYIYEAPITSTYGAKFWTSEQSVEQASLAMYVQLRSCLRTGSSHFVFGDLTTDLFHCSYNANWTLNAVKSSNSPAFNYSYVPYREGDLQDWSRFYRLIAQCNLVLQNVPAMADGLFSSKAVKDSYVSEALFIRAYAYFYMIRVWGDPVHVTKTYNDVDYGNIPPVPRSPENQVLDSCLKDLRVASGYLNYANGDRSKSIRANKGSAYALMGHIFAWKHQYDSAHVYCSKVINEGGYSLEPMNTYSNIWAGQKSAESIFELPMVATNSSLTSETDGGFFSVFLKGEVLNNTKQNCWVIPNGGTTNYLFSDHNDARFTKLLQPVAATNGDEAGYMLLKYSNIQYKNPQDKTGLYANNNLVLLRLSDILLLDAEALASTGNVEGARNLLKQTQIRAGINSYANPATAYDMLDEIIVERGRELMGEGCWFYDLVRTNEAQGWLPAVGYPTDRVTPANKGYYWPLDMNTLFPYDNLLTQNPWWMKHK
ncbi:RagB/SusD family nutrient uptake outer membrane protein [Chitinophagaceae bacterium LB-8]|uniref:RagB/SusD family nutrient uptake outer membrane protein n=1 Tax=Paraflavisolibacter caeni TaxID=2982496 RepID=A0A9X2XSS3_9BACT|nr:RagB/SusD family nutrient uptake outer membrane protein [Paraflavisolibacter caeni]MCU7547780.1 RagB/SusD family nutrient uptake outer membrane protein [Paraflavisolibacter caeni]